MPADTHICEVDLGTQTPTLPVNCILDNQYIVIVPTTGLGQIFAVPWGVEVFQALAYLILSALHVDTRAELLPIHCIPSSEEHSPFWLYLRWTIIYRLDDTLVSTPRAPRAQSTCLPNSTTGRATPMRRMAL
jgi:hypothetical protein